MSCAINFEEQQRAVIGPMQILEDKQNRFLPRRPMKERADGISHVETNRLVVRPGRRLEGEALTQLRQDETDVPGPRREESPDLVRRHVLGECAKRLRPRPVWRRTFAIAAPAPEDAHSALRRLGREFLGKRRLADPWLTGSQHDLSAAAERAVKRMTQLCQLVFAVEEEAIVRNPR